MIRLEDIVGINVEPSARCNARCPFCSRNEKRRPYDHHLLTVQDVKLLPTSRLQSLQWLSFSGNFGDPCTNSELPEIAHYFKTSHPSLMLMGSTNGSVQSESWWKRLGQNYSDGVMLFSLDGLADTHARHRVGTRFDKIISNLEAFTSGGGIAHWQFILFKHNEHQVQDAENLAKETGCARFFVLSSREYNELCQRPTNSTFELKDEIFNKFQKQAAESDNRAYCKPLKNHSIYFAADGTVHPCCLAHCNYITEHEPAFEFIVKLIATYKDEINFKTKPLEDILNSSYFKAVLKESVHNSYCRTKCNKYRKQARAQLILRDTYFN